MKPILVAGHPLHPALVHLPMGALPLVLVADIVLLLGGGAQWWPIAFWLAVAGLCGAVLAAGAGLLDYLALPDDNATLGIANRHLWLMIAAAGCFLVRLIVQHAPSGPNDAGSILPICCSAAGTLLLMIGGWFGAEMVYGGDHSQ